MPAEGSKLRIDLSRYELSLDGKRVRLERQPMELLILFARRQGQLVSREDIVEKLWGNDVFVDVDHSINAAVRKIRTAIRDNPVEPRFLETVVGKGYRLVGEVEVVGAVPPVAENSGKPADPAARGSRNVTLVVAGCVVAVCLLAAMAWSVRRWQHRTPSEAQIHSIAVLPLANLSGDPTQEYFADGMTDELISDLAQISALRVISRTSVMQYKNLKKSMRDVAKELNVDAVVEGTVERSGRRVRISTQLIQARTDTHLWAKTYERDLGDVIALQDEVAGAIAEEIRIKLLPNEIERLATPRATNPEAYEAYLQGLYHIYKRNQTDLEQSTSYFQRAVELDPNYALAYAGLADSYVLRGSLLYMVVAPRDVMPKSKAAAQRALQIDSNLGEAYATLAYVETLYDWDWTRSEEDFRRAIALKPNYAQGHLWYAMHLAAMGRQRDSIAEGRRAQELDPLSLLMSSTIGLLLFFADEDDSAIEQFHKVLELDRDFFIAHWELGLVYEKKRMYEEARSEFQKAKALSPGNPSILESLGEVDALSGRKGEARAILQELDQLSKQEFVSPYVMALFNVALGNKDQAFVLLERAYDRRDNNLILLKVEPAFRTLHSDARFQSLLQRMGLPN